jgi:hypothetical protein
MLAYTYRLRVGQRLRHLALLTAIGAVLNVADRHPTTVDTSKGDVTYGQLAPGNREVVRYHHAMVYVQGGCDGLRAHHKLHCELVTIVQD